MHVGARLAFRRHAVHHADRLAVHQDDALVALPHCGLVALEHQRLARTGEMHLQQRREILVVRLDAEHAGAAVAEQRLDDDVVVFEAERADGLEVPGDHGGGHQLGKMRDQQFFGGVADRGGVVHHQRLRMDVLEQVRGCDVGHVERRVLAHQHHVHRREIELGGFAECVVAAAPAFHGDGARAGEQPFLAPFTLALDALAQRHMAYLVVPQSVASSLGLQHEGEGRVGVDVDRFDRVHLDRDLERACHAQAPCGIWRYSL